MREILTGFQAFVVRGNLIVLAVAFVIGTAFAAVVMALVENLITPLVAAIIGEPSFAGLSFTINDSAFGYGNFLNALVTFVSIAAAVYFFIVVPYEKLQERQGISPDTKACEHCKSTIPLDATRCAFCTSQLGVARSPAT